MISSTELLRRTGLKSAKTLTRWYQLGLIPKPELRTHPSGRGKLGYWPDWVLDRCLKMREAQRQGRSLRGAVSLMELRDMEGAKARPATAPPGMVDVSKRTLKVKLEAGEKELSGLDFFIGLILSDLKPLMLSHDVSDLLIARLRESQALDMALERVRDGFNPVLLFSGSQVQITTDFMVGAQLAHQGEQGRPALLVPLLHPLRRVLVHLRDARDTTPRIQPALKVWERDGSNLFELSVLPGQDGFRVVREPARRSVPVRSRLKRGVP